MFRPTVWRPREISRRSLSSLLILLLAVLGVSEAPRSAMGDENPIDFVRDIEPLLQQNCYSCHGEDEQEGQLRLDARAIVMRGGISGALFTPGDSTKSLLLDRLRGVGDADQMPPDEDPLTAAEIDLIKRWIEAGAPWPKGVGSPVDALDMHWAYQPAKKAALPAVSRPEWVLTPLDAFALAKLDQHQLSPAPPAEKATLLRRVSLDLIGLPPTIEEVDAFLADSRPDAYQRVVARLLASPQFGERWARPWLDLARYADSNGYQADQYREVWPYRDWVIRAINADLPFDQFTIEQIAGDLLPNATLDQKIATGFHRLTTCNVEAGVDPEENRVNQILDRVITTGSVWLGTTFDCAQCHNHKYDPFTQKDFYQIFAYFNNTPLEVEGDGVTYNFYGPKMELPLSPARAARRKTVQEKLAAVQQERTKLLAVWKKEQAAWETRLLAAARSAPKWHVLEVESFVSTGGASGDVLEDQSVLVGGKRPDKDEYTVVVRTDLAGITAFKLETLTDASLPANGPGRHDAPRPNFVLQEFEVYVGGEPESSQKIVLHGAKADFSQQNWLVEGAIDGQPETGWAINPQFGKPHEATFLTQTPCDAAATTGLRFVMKQHHGGGRTLGRFRLLAMTGNPGAGNPGEKALPADVVKVLKTPAKKRSKKQDKVLQDFRLAGEPRAKKIDQTITQLEKQLAALKPATSLIMVEQKEPRVTRVFERGNFLSPTFEVSASPPDIFMAAVKKDAPVANNGAKRQTRIDLAKWLVGPEQPLTPRVTVNRWWLEIFGQGIVATAEDFGAQGDPPSHPLLLDWLARELVDSGWSRKHVLRLIVSSAVYRQSSRISPEKLEKDPYNKLLSRGPRFRLPAETVRDNALTFSGLLCRKMSGPPVFPPQPDGLWRSVGRNAPKYVTSHNGDRFRRGVYTYWLRSTPYPGFMNFDAPDRTTCTIKRSRTNTPLQALTLLNDQAYVEMAAALALRIMGNDTHLSAVERVEYAFRLCLSRRPTDMESQHLLEVYQRELQRFQEHPEAVQQLLAGFEQSIQPPSPDLPRAQWAAWFYLSNILLNLDEVITKG